MLNGEYFYNQTLKKTVAIFGTVFNNIKILKPGGGNTYMRVPLAYGSRKKFLARIQTDLTGPDSTSVAIKLPRMSFEISNIELDTTSKLNRFNTRVVSYDEDNAHASTIRQSTPYNIGMQLNIYATNQDDALQIFEQILPHFSPEYTISVKDIEGPGTVTDVPIILNSTSISDDYEGDFQTRKTLIYTLDFTMKIKFSGAVTSNKALIRTIDLNYFTNMNLNSTDIATSTRIEVAPSDEPPLDDSDTITITYDFLEND